MGQDTPPANTSAPLRLMIDRAPLTLNPRRAGDATSQRLGTLIFRALTRIDKDLVPQPDLASSWHILDGGRTWRFEIRPDLKDHEGESITAAKIAECLESYRSGKPTALLRGSFPGWRSVEARDASVSLKFEKASPYLARNISVLRYFRSEGGAAPCSEPAQKARLVGSGPYRPENWDPAPERELKLAPIASDRKPLVISFVPDDNARVLKLLRGEVDVTQNSLSVTKERWLEQNYSDRFDVFEREGVNVSYLAFNMRDPLLSRLEVRQAIAQSINREEIVRHKFMGVCQVAGSLLSPRLKEGAPQAFKFDPINAERLLDQAGYPRRGRSGTRFELRYRTNTVREFIETGLMIRDQLGRIGIHVVLDVVEGAIFLASIKKGAFQLYSSIWVGISDGSILHRTMRSGEPDNRVAYRNAEMDRILDLAAAEPDESKRIPLAQEAQRLMASELPYFPLWYWKNTAITRKGLTGLSARDLSLSGSYEPLTRLR